LQMYCLVSCKASHELVCMYVFCTIQRQLPVSVHSLSGLVRWSNFVVLSSTIFRYQSTTRSPLLSISWIYCHVMFLPMNMIIDTTINERNRFQPKMNMYLLICTDFMLQVSTYIQVIIRHSYMNCKSSYVIY
jgi:hypothetical protein